MTYRLVIQPEAEADLDEAYRWYENQRSGLGNESIECVEAVFERRDAGVARRCLQECTAGTRETISVRCLLRI